MHHLINGVAYCLDEVKQIGIGLICNFVARFKIKIFSKPNSKVYLVSWAILTEPKLMHHLINGIAYCNFVAPFTIKIFSKPKKQSAFYRWRRLTLIVLK